MKNKYFNENGKLSGKQYLTETPSRNSWKWKLFKKLPKNSEESRTEKYFNKTNSFVESLTQLNIAPKTEPAQRDYL